MLFEFLVFQKLPSNLHPLNSTCLRSRPAREDIEQPPVKNDMTLTAISDMNTLQDAVRPSRSQDAIEG